MRRVVFRLACALSTVLVLSACAELPSNHFTEQAAPLSSQDVAALKQLAEVAGPSSGVAPHRITSTACWIPSEHALNDPTTADTAWRVLCRVGWVDTAGQQRHQDTTCIGDFAALPMLNRCYRWTHYDQMPRFEDESSVFAG